VFAQSVYESLTDFGNTFKKGEDNTLLAYYKNSTTLLDGKPAFKAIYLTKYNASLFENAFGYKSSTSKAMFIATLVPEKKSYFAVACFAVIPVISIITVLCSKRWLTHFGYTVKNR